MEDARRARMGLATAQDAGEPAMVALVRDRGVEEVWKYAHAGSGRTALAKRAQEVDVDEVARQTEAVGARFIIPGDEEWPWSVDDLAWGEPVGGFGGEPLGLWVAGPARLGRLRSPVAIVGSRASTAYGEHCAGEFAAGLAEKGCAIISGGAYGVDASAHRGALAVKGQTVAVMAGGLGQVYPPGNSGLLRAVQAKGALVSEYPPGRAPSRARFLVRNRLIAALSAATMIVEAAVRSGARNTISWALSIHRPVLAVPGPITSAMSVTPHRLIREGAAILVTSVEEVMEVIGSEVVQEVLPGVGPETRLEEGRGEGSRVAPGAAPEADALIGIGAAVHEALRVRRGRSVDEVVAATGERVGTVQAALTRLADAGLAEETTPGWWRRGSAEAKARLPEGGGGPGRDTAPEDCHDRVG